MTRTINLRGGGLRFQSVGLSTALLDRHAAVAAIHGDEVVAKAVDDMHAFSSWCAVGGARAAVTEISVLDSSDPRWQPVLNAGLTAARADSMITCGFSAGASSRAFYGGYGVYYRAGSTSSTDQGMVDTEGVTASVWKSNPGDVSDRSRYQSGLHIVSLEIQSPQNPGFWPYVRARGTTIARQPFSVAGVTDQSTGAVNASFQLIVNQVNEAMKSDVLSILTDYPTPWPPSQTPAMVNSWLAVSRATRTLAGAYALELTNEPDSVPGGQTVADWHASAQSVVTTLRSDGEKRLIIVPTWDHKLGSLNHNRGEGKAWISDAAGNLAYSAHWYPTRDEQDATQDYAIAVNKARQQGYQAIN